MPKKWAPIISVTLAFLLSLNMVLFPNWGFASLLNSSFGENASLKNLNKNTDLLEIDESNVSNTVLFNSMSNQSCPNLIKSFSRYKNYDLFKEWYSTTSPNLVSSTDFVDAPAPLVSSTDFVDAPAPLVSSTNFVDAPAPLVSSTDFVDAPAPLVSSTDFVDAPAPLVSSTDFVDAPAPLVSSTDFVDAPAPLVSSTDFVDAPAPLVSSTDVEFLSTHFEKLNFSTQHLLLKSTQSIKDIPTCLSLYETLNSNPSYKPYIKWLIRSYSDHDDDSIVDEPIKILESSILPNNPNIDIDLTIEPPLPNKLIDNITYTYQWQKQKRSSPNFYQKRTFKESNYRSYLKILDPSDPSYSTDHTLNLDFVFSFYDDNYQSISINPDGFITFDPFSDFLTNEFSKEAESEWNHSIIPFIAPLKINPNLIDLENVIISSQYFGTSPEREFVIQWEGSLLNETQDLWRTQLHLRESDSSIFFAYDLVPKDLNSEDVQIGIQDALNKKSPGDPIEYSLKKLYDSFAPMQIKMNTKFEDIPYRMNFFPKDSLEMDARYRVIITPHFKGNKGVPFTSSPVSTSFEHPLAPIPPPPEELTNEILPSNLPAFSDYLGKPPLYTIYSGVTIDPKNWIPIVTPTFTLYPLGQRIMSQPFNQILQSESLDIPLSEDQYRSGTLNLAVSRFNNLDSSSSIDIPQIWVDAGGVRYDGVISGDYKIFIINNLNLLHLTPQNNIYLLPIHFYINFLANTPPGIYDLSIYASYE